MSQKYVHPTPLTMESALDKMAAVRRIATAEKQAEEHKEDKKQMAAARAGGELTI